ncbi:MAG: hypothetical protein C0606_16505 [Hyphomicrobiales bacterium]|nr:MAG: hypothetical protein C0606_16505 [Hyphomicrobiales bacterium]
MDEDRLTPERLAAANIHPETWLATDYLNHFNEAIMLIEMVPAMPDCAAEVLEWEPKTYAQHFEDTNFQEKELAIEAYQAADPMVRASFEAVLDEFNACLAALQTMLRESDPANPEVQLLLSSALEETLKPAVSKTSGIIHGGAAPDSATLGDGAQADIDLLFG